MPCSRGAAVARRGDRRSSRRTRPPPRPGGRAAASTATLSPCTTLKTPSGSPASAYSSAIEHRTPTGPARWASARTCSRWRWRSGCIHIGTMAGKLNGVMPAHTPSGWRSEYASTPVDTWSENSPFSSCGMPQANSTTSRPRITSPLASEITLPCSAETTAARSSRCRSTRSRNANMIRARRVRETSCQASKAFFAVCTARSTSAGSASSTRAWTCPAAGLYTSAVRVDAPAVAAPPIQCSNVFIVPRFTDSRAARVSPARRHAGPGRVLSSAAVCATGTSHQLSGDGHRRQRVGLDVHHRGPRRLPRLAQGHPELIDRPRAQHVRAQALRVGGQVHRQVAAVQQARTGIRGSGTGCRTAASRRLSDSEPILAKPWLSISTMTSLMPSATAVTISCAIIR